MQISVGKVVGTPTQSSWVQVHEFLPLEEEKINKRGRIIAVLSFKEAPEGIEAVSAGREILSRLHEEYFGDLNKTPFEQLSKACSAILEEFPEYDLEVVVCVFWKDFVYFVAGGEGQVFLWRNGKLSTLLVGTKDQTSSLSGSPKPGDVFLFGTNETFQKITQATLLELLTKNISPKALADNLVPLVHKDESSSQALAVVGVEIDKRSLSLRDKDKDIERDAGKETTVVQAGWQEKIRGFAPNLGVVKTLLHKLASRLPEKNVYVENVREPDEGRRRRNMIAIGIILLLLLGASVFFGVRQKNLLNYRSSYEDRLISAQTALSDALLQKEANPSQARELFMRAQETIDNLRLEGIKDERIDEITRKFEENKIAILGKVEANTAVLRDLSILRSDIAASQISLHKGSLGILDLGGKRVVVSSSDGKETTVIGGPEKLGNPQFVTVYADRYFVFGDRGVVELDRKGAAKVAVQPDSQWGEIAGMAAFSGNLYLVDKNNQVWRYSATDAGFGTKQAWFAKDVNTDLSKTVDIAIDSSVWLLSSSGKISKFTRGSPDSFTISGVSDGIVSPAALYTDENLDNIYILDKSGGKIVEVSKKGEYQKQYVAEDLKQARDFVVASGKIIVLTENKLLEIGLK